MTALTAAVACLRRVRTILGNVACAVALVARNVTHIPIVHGFRAITRPVTELVTLIASGIVSLCALLRDVTDSIATITAFCLLRTGTRKVPNLIALVALFASTTASHITASTYHAATGIAVAGKVAWTVALVTRGS